MQWSTPTFPVDVQDECTLQTFDHALLTRVGHGPLRAINRPNGWFRGAVHDSSGALVEASQKLGGLGGNQWVAADPASVPVREDLDELPGTWLYGGHWMRHFGHFITETVTTLWPRDLEVDGLVFHKYFPSTPPVADWQRFLIELAGYGDLPIRIVKQRPLRAERLLVPSRSVVANGWAHPEAVDVWRRMVERLGQPRDTPRIFLSRTRFNSSTDSRRPRRTTAERDAALDELFAAAGFAVISPELLAVEEQLRLLAGARVVAGAAGSALHLAAFAPAGARVLEIGDDRSPTWPVPMQRVVDTACGHEHAFVAADTPVDQIATILEDLEVSSTKERQ